MANFKKFLSNFFTLQRMVGAGILLAVLVALLLFFDRAVMPWYTKHGEALAVPNVVAKRYQAAKDLLDVHELIAVKAGEKHDSDLPFGYVVEQNPRANRLVKKGRRVYLTISVGEREIEVPELTGLSETNAQERIKSYGLRIGEVFYEYVPNEPADVVVSQSVQHGTLARASTGIDITVSLGRPTENVAVPSVRAKTLEVAKRDILKAGLVVGKITYRLSMSGQFLPNTVIDQSIEPGEIVKHGTTLDLLITTFGEDQ